jgi:hypothetical protein
MKHGRIEQGAELRCNATKSADDFELADPPRLKGNIHKVLADNTLPLPIAPTLSA